MRNNTLKSGGGRRPLRSGLVLIAAALVLASMLSVSLPSTPASAYPSADVSFDGHGYGHGYGMGQWGALGYAVAGTSYQSILGYYYGGTSVATLNGAQEATNVHVAMTVNNGNTVIVTSGSGYTVAGHNVAAGQGVMMAQAAGNTWNLYVGAGCAGPWPSSPTYSGIANPVATPDTDPAVGDPDTGSEALQLCQGPGNITMRGQIQATYNSNGASRTINIVPLEDYVSGVVPNESPAGWGTLGGAGPQGQAWGFQELEAQAVAVRSYMMAAPGSYASYVDGAYADTCDLDCQTYRGVANESAISDLAATATAGQVMEFPSGAIASTQYSSSNGGYSNPGTFPGVPDTGDAICIPGACNPNHDWTVSVPVSTIDATWPQLGNLQSISITGRNGDGDWGGRVTSMVLNGSNQNVSLTGDAFASAIGLKSDWFTTTTTTAVSSPAVGIAATNDGQGYWIAGNNGAVYGFGDASYDGAANGLALSRPVVGMAATPDGHGYWLVASDGGIFTYGDAGFYGSTGGMVLNKPIVGMASTPDGKGYWLVASDGGIFSFGDAQFYGSTGSLVLNKPVVGMASTPDGHGYWLVASDGGIFSFGDAQFYGSTGSLTLNKPVVGMTSTPQGQGYWMVASDGGIFSFGNAAFHGSTGSLTLNKPVVGMASTPDGNGYWLVASDGGLFTFGTAGFFGSAAG